MSRAKENIKSENIAISKEGIKVNKAKEIIYFLLATDPRTLILFLIELRMSKNIRKKNKSNKDILTIIKI